MRVPRRAGRGKGYWKRYRGRALAAVLVAAVLLFIGSSVWMNIRLVEMGNRMSYLQDTANVVQTDLTSLQAELERTLRKENGILEEYSIEVVDADFAAGTYQLQIDVIPKEYTENTELSIYFGTGEYPLKKDGFHFTGTVELPMTEAYDGNVTVLKTNGRKKSTEILQDYEGYPTLLEESLTGSLVEPPTYEKGRFVVDSTVEYQLMGQSLLGMEQFESLCLVVAVDGEEHLRQQLITQEAVEQNPGDYVGPVESVRADVRGQDGSNSGGHDNVIGSSSGEAGADGTIGKDAGAAAAGTIAGVGVAGTTGTIAGVGVAGSVGTTGAGAGDGDTGMTGTGAGAGDTGSTETAVGAEAAGSGVVAGMGAGTGIAGSVGADGTVAGAGTAGPVGTTGTVAGAGTAGTTGTDGGTTDAGLTAGLPTGGTTGMSDAGAGTTSKEETGSTVGLTGDGITAPSGMEHTDGLAAEPSAGIVKRLAGTVSLDFREDIQEGESVRIFLQALSTDGVVCERKLFAVSAGLREDGTSELLMEEGLPELVIRNPDGGSWQFK